MIIQYILVQRSAKIGDTGVGITRLEKAPSILPETVNTILMAGLKTARFGSNQSGSSTMCAQRRMIIKAARTAFTRGKPMFDTDSFLLGFTACFLLLWAIGAAKDNDK